MNKRTRKNRINKRKGGMSGIMPKQGINPEDAFNYFLDNSKFTYLSQGSNGITFILTLSKDDLPKSPYISTDAKTYGNPVRELILKVVLISETKPNTEINLNYADVSFNLYLSSENDFKEEIEVQKEVYLKTMNYLEPICPAIVYSNVYNSKNRHKLLNKLLKSESNKRFFDNYANQETQRKIQALSSYALPLEDKYDSIGVIGMEYAGGYQVMGDLETSKKFKVYKEMALYLLLILALKTGYSHADFHYGNIMINPNDGDYFLQTDDKEPKIIGKPLLLDFGLAVKIPSVELTKIEDYCRKQMYTNALRILCTIRRKDNYDVTKRLFMYGWVCGTVDPNKTREQIYDEINEKIMKKVLYLQYSLPSSMSEDKKEALLEKEYNKQSEILRKEMMSPLNMRYSKDTNEMLSLLFRQRLRAQFVLKERFKKIHPNGPTLPLTEQSKEEIMEDIETPSTSATTSLNVIPNLSQDFDNDDEDEAPELVPLNPNANIQNATDLQNTTDIQNATDIQNLAKISFAQNNKNTQKQNRFGNYNPLRYFYPNKNKPVNSSCDPNNISNLNDFATIKEKMKECCPKTFGIYTKNRSYCKNLDSHYKKIYEDFRRKATNEPLKNGPQCDEYERSKLRTKEDYEMQIKKCCPKSIFGSTSQYCKTLKNTKNMFDLEANQPYNTQYRKYINKNPNAQKGGKKTRRKNRKSRK